MLKPGGKSSKNTPGNHNPNQCNHKLNDQYIHHKPDKVTEGKDLIETYDADGKRILIVPNRKPINRPVIMGRTEFNRLKHQGHVVTLEHRMQLIEEAEKNKTQLMNESAARKDNLLKTQQLIPSSKLETVESEAASNNLYLLRRSKELLLEQDERVKAANRIIFATKCKAVRNAQIAEKHLIEQHLEEENHRLDLLMEQQRLKTVEVEHRKQEQNQKKKEKYVREIKQQITEREMTRLLAAEKIEEESKMLNKALVALQKEEEEKLMKKRERQLKMQEEFRNANAEAEYYKSLKNQEQKILDLRIQEFTKQKAEREEARDRELAVIKLAKEQEIARMRAQQEKSKDIQAALGEMHALRSREEKEKEWREKEKIAAEIKLKINRDLQMARQQQIDDIRKSQAVSLSRDEKDFKKVAKVQRELFEKHKQEQEKKCREIEKHRRDLLKQINEKEKERIKWLHEKFEDGKAQRLEYEVKDKNVEDYLKQKVDRLRDSNIPEQYVNGMQRQLQRSNEIV